MRALPLVLALGLGCRQDYDLVSLDPGAGPQPSHVVDHGVRGAPVTPGPARPTAPTTRPRRPLHPRPDLVAQEVPLGGGAQSDVVDFLFVIDGSSSMKQLVEQVYDGFDALVAEGAFPKDARIAVTGTTPADPDRRTRTHAAVHKGKQVRYDPGFQRLVDADGILRYRATYPEMEAAFALDGCDAWSRPGDRNEAGVPCFEAHTQLGLVGVGVEAGLTAVNQLLQQRQVFRTGAAANIVFVSDTQDPGLSASAPGFEDLVALRPTGPELVQTAASRQLTSSMRLHAITPVTECGSEPYAHLGDVYGDAARATGGRTLDVCTATPADYVDLIRAIVEDGAVPTEPVIPLERTERVRAVFVDGVEAKYHLSRDKRAIVLDAEMPAQRSNVRVEYKVPVPQRLAAPPAAKLAPR